MATLVQVVDEGLEPQLKSINDQISTLNKLVSSLENGLKEVPSKKAKKEDMGEYISTLVMFLGHYQELKEEFINLGRKCINLKNNFPDLQDCSINREYGIKQRLDEIHRTINSLVYSS